jgi:hypothetical protein
MWNIGVGKKVHGSKRGAFTHMKRERKLDGGDKILSLGSKYDQITL